MADKTIVNQHESSQWETCAEGTLTEYARRDRSRRGRQSALLASGAVVTGCLIIAAIAYFPGSDSAQPAPSPTHVASELLPYGGMRCNDVLQRMDSFLAGDISAEGRAPIQRHLQDCEMCRVAYQGEAERRGVTIAHHDPLQSEFESNTVSILENPKPSVLLAIAANCP